MSLKLYLDFLSQPSRALYIFMKLNKIPFELCPVALRKGVHLTDEFKQKFNRFQRVPFIHENDFKLSESIAIVRYVADKNNLNNDWYPKDVKRRAEIDEYLEWQHLNTRLFCASYFQQKWLLPLTFGKPSNPETVKKHKENMITCLDQIENIWLANTPYINGNKISVADIFAACEVEQPRIAGYDPSEGRPALSTWLDKVRKETGTPYEEAHAIVNKLINKNKEGSQTK